MTLRIKYGENSFNNYIFEAPDNNSEPPPYLQQAAYLVAKNKEPGLELDTIPENDDYIFDELVLGDLTGAYRLESYGAQCFIQMFQPQDISDLIYILALDCPGPLLSGALSEYIDRKSQNLPISYMHPGLKPILRNSHGAILYRNQVVEIAKSIGGYAAEEANELRMTLEECLPGEIRNHQHRFISGAVKNWLDQPIAERIFERIAWFSRYDFRDEWQAADHALMAYRSAYLKIHYPEEYMTAMDNCMGTKVQPSCNACETTADLKPLVTRFMQARITAEDFSGKANTICDRLYAELFGLSITTNKPR